MNGVRIGAWLSKLHYSRQYGTLPRYLVTALEEIPGWTWKAHVERNAKILRRVEILREIVAREGPGVLETERTIDGVALRGWLATVRRHWQVLLARGDA